MKKTVDGKPGTKRPTYPTPTKANPNTSKAIRIAHDLDIASFRVEGRTATRSVSRARLLACFARLTNPLSA
jgi:hypothetical protein